MTTGPHLLKIQNTDRLQKRKKLSIPDRCNCKYFHIWCLAESMVNIANQEISSAIWRWLNVQKAIPCNICLLEPFPGVCKWSSEDTDRLEMNHAIPDTITMYQNSFCNFEHEDTE